MKRKATTLLALPVLALALAACGAGGTPAADAPAGTPDPAAAQSAYDACRNLPGAVFDVLHLDGADVTVAAKGEAAEALGTVDVSDPLTLVEALGSGEITDEEQTALQVAVTMTVMKNCLAGNTEFPEDGTELAHGAQWDGWTYSEETGVNGSFIATFSARS